jgi:branched-chain amino acid transport system ATP-binding protein
LFRGFDRSDERRATARRYAERAVQLAPNDPEALAALGVYYFVRGGDIQRAQELLDYVGLGKSAELLSRNMPYGDQRRLEIARALATDPQLLLLDEPTAGMNPKETEETMHLIRKIRDGGLAVVVIEHDMRFIFNLCDRVLCLFRGSLLVEGTPGEVQSDHRVIEAYIGGDDEEESA